MCFAAASAVRPERAGRRMDDQPSIPAMRCGTTESLAVRRNTRSLKLTSSDPRRSRAGGFLFELAVATDQGIRRTVVPELGLILALELRDDFLGENLAELDTPLVKRVDVPDRALCKHAVFVKCDQCPENRWCELFGQQDVGGTVSLEGTVRYEPVGRTLGA